MARYAEAADLAQVGLSSDLTTGIDAAVINGVLDKRSRFADGYLAGRWTLPLTAWGDDLRLAVCQLAAWDIMTTVVGMNPEDASNSNWRDRRDEALSWLRDVAAGKVTPVGIVDTTPDVPEAGVSIGSEPLRGWGRYGRYGY